MCPCSKALDREGQQLLSHLLLLSADSYTDPFPYPPPSRSLFFLTTLLSALLPPERSSPEGTSSSLIFLEQLLRYDWRRAFAIRFFSAEGLILPSNSRVAFLLSAAPCAALKAGPAFPPPFRYFITLPALCWCVRGPPPRARVRSHHLHPHLQLLIVCCASAS